MACTSWVRDELEGNGWLVNQTRMWWASHWTVRHGRDWRDGEDDFFRHLLDGSRAANRLGWQWTVGAGTGKPYGFSRWQVEKRAPQLCRSCPLQRRLPDPGLAGRRARSARRGQPAGLPRRRFGGRRPGRARRRGHAGGGLAHGRVARRQRPGARRPPGPARRLRVRRAAARVAAPVRQAAGVPRRVAGRPGRPARGRRTSGSGGRRAGRHAGRRDPRRPCPASPRARPPWTSPSCTRGRGWRGPRPSGSRRSAPGARASAAEAPAGSLRDQTRARRRRTAVAAIPTKPMVVDTNDAPAAAR